MGKEKLLASFFWKLMERVGVQVISIIVQIVLARLVAPKQFGILAIIVVFYNIFDIFVQKGFGSAIIRMKELTQEDIDTAFIVSGLIAIVLFFVIIVTAPYVGLFYGDNSIVSPLMVLSVSLLISPFYCIYNSLLVRDMNFKVIFIRGIVSALLSGLLGVWLALRGLEIWAMVAQIIANQVLLTIVMAVGLNYHLGFSFSSLSFKAIFSFGKNVLFTELLLYIVESVRTFSIGKMYSSAQLAYYDRGQTYPNVMMNAINDTFFSILLPYFSKVQDDTYKLKEIYLKYTRLLIFIVVPIFMGLAAVSREFIEALLTKRWQPAVPYLIIFCLYQTIFPYQTISKVLLYAKGESKMVWNIEIWKSILSLILMVISLNIGALYVALSLLFVRLFCICLYLRRLNTIAGECNAIRYSFKPFISALIMFCMIFFMPTFDGGVWLMLLMKMLIGGCIYILMESIIDCSFVKSCLSVIYNKIKNEKSFDNRGMFF